MIDYWLITSVSLSGIGILLRNKLDLIFVFYCSNFLYHHGIIFNNISTGSFNDIPSAEAKCVIAVVFSSLLIVQLMLIAFARKKTESYSYDCQVLGVKSGRIFHVFLYISLVSTLLFVASAGSDIFYVKSISKDSAIPFTFFGSYYFAYASSGYFFLTKKYKAFALTVLLILFYLFVGTRAFAVLFFINVIILLSAKDNLFSRKSLRNAMFLVVVFIFLAIYKHFYIALKALNFGEVYDIYMTLDMSKVFWMLLSAEWSQISMNVNRVTLLENQSLYSFWDMLVMNIPGFNGWSNHPERFSEVIYYYANPGYTYGLGGAFWVEIWYAHGYLGVFILSQLVLWYVVYCNSLLFSHVGAYLIHSPLAIFIAFYIPRNDFSLLLGSTKNLLISITIGVIIVNFLPWKSESGDKKNAFKV